MKYIICGIERIGVKVVEFLLAAGETVTIITLDGRELLLAEIKEQVSRYVEGDARHIEVLKQAGIDDADVLMALTGNDMKNIEIHLAAKSLHPGIKVITSLAAEGLHKDIESGFGIHKTLSIPALAAPSFVSACLNELVLHTFRFYNQSWFLGVAHILENSLLCGRKVAEIETIHNIHAFWLEKASDGSFSLPLSEQILIPGEKLFFITQDKAVFQRFSPKDNLSSAAPKGTGRILGRSHTYEDFIRDRFKNIPKTVQWITVSYLLLMIVSVILFHVGIRYSIIDALYFYITTTTTVGFGDFNLKDVPAVYKLYGCFIMMAGAALLAAIYGVIADFLISKRFEHFFGTTRYNLRNHIIIIGLGKFGYRVTNLLNENGFRVAAIEKEMENNYAHLVRGKIPIVFGDAQFSNILLKAGIHKARTIAAITNDDLKNISILLQAQKLNPQVRTVTRLFNSKVEQTATTSFKIDRVLSTSIIAAPYFLAAVIPFRTISAFEWEDTVYILFEVKVCQIPAFLSLTPNQLFDEYHIALLAVGENSPKLVFVPGDHRFTEDETLILIGKYQDIQRL